VEEKNVGWVVRMSGYDGLICEQGAGGGEGWLGWGPFQCRWGLDGGSNSGRY